MKIMHWCLISMMLVCTADQPETFVIQKPKNKTAAHLKDELASCLEELAHQSAREIEAVGRAQQELLVCMRELLENKSDGRFSGATYAQLQKDLRRAEKLCAEREKIYEQTKDLIHFLQGR